jgi:hypothetical protein
VVNRKAVQRLMWEMGIAAIYPGPTSAANASGRRCGPICCAGWWSPAAGPGSAAATGAASGA